MYLLYLKCSFYNYYGLQVHCDRVIYLYIARCFYITVALSFASYDSYYIMCHVVLDSD